MASHPLSSISPFLVPSRPHRGSRNQPRAVTKAINLGSGLVPGRFLCSMDALFVLRTLISRGLSTFRLGPLLGRCITREAIIRSGFHRWECAPAKTGGTMMDMPSEMPCRARSASRIHLLSGRPSTAASMFRLSHRHLVAE